MSEVEFVSMASLLERSASVGAIATAIERDGICGWDRYGRFIKFDKASEPASAALDRLARYYAVVSSGRDADGSGLADPEDDPLYLYGWAAGEEPALDEPERVVSKAATRPQAQARTQNASLRLVDALRRFAIGELTGRFHPESPTEEALIGKLAEFTAMGEGLGRETLKKRFREAAELWGR